MNEVDWSNPLTAIVVFFSVMLAGFVFMVKLLPAIIGFGLFGSLFSLFAGGFVWFSIFTEK